MYRNLGLFLLLLTALNANSVLANGPKKTKKGQMTGHVRDQANKPLPEAYLRLLNCDALAGNCKNSDLRRGASSEKNGSFVLNAEGLQPGVYTLEATLPPFYLSKAKVPVNLPQDDGKSFDFTMQPYVRDAAGNLVGVSPDDAKEILAAARIEKNAQVEVLCAKILNDTQLVPNVPNKQETPKVAENSPSASGNQQASTSSSSGSDSSSGDYSSASSSSVNTLEGCLSGSAGNFTLTDQSGKTYQLAGDTSKLSDHVGHHVRITGSEGSGAGESASSSSSSGQYYPGTEGGTSGSAQAASSASGRFNVKKVKIISSSCSSSN